MYQTLLFPSRSIKRLSDGAIIPPDEANVDYQDYLNWLSQGNTPLEADNG